MPLYCDRPWPRRCWRQHKKIVLLASVCVIDAGRSETIFVAQLDAIARYTRVGAQTSRRQSCRACQTTSIYTTRCVAALRCSTKCLAFPRRSRAGHEGAAAQAPARRRQHEPAGGLLQAHGCAGPRGYDRRHYERLHARSVSEPRGSGGGFDAVPPKRQPRERTAARCRRDSARPARSTGLGRGRQPRRLLLEGPHKPDENLALLSATERAGAPSTTYGAPG